MYKFLLIPLILISIFSLNCKDKKEKRIIEIKEPDKKQVDPQTNILKTSLTPEKFFRITREIYKISKGYTVITNENELEKMDNKMGKIYKKYNTTKKEYDQYGEKNYQDLEKYRKENPEIDKSLRKVQ